MGARGPAGRPSIAELARSTLLAVLALACVIPPGALATSHDDTDGPQAVAVHENVRLVEGWSFREVDAIWGDYSPGGLSASFAVSTWAERLDRTVYANLTNADATSLEALPEMRRLVQIFHPTRKPHARPELRDQHDADVPSHAVRRWRDRGVRRGDQVRRPEHRRRRQGEQRQRHGSHGGRGRPGLGYPATAFLNEAATDGWIDAANTSGTGDDRDASGVALVMDARNPRWWRLTSPATAGRGDVLAAGGEKLVAILVPWDETPIPRSSTAWTRRVWVRNRRWRACRRWFRFIRRRRCSCGEGPGR